MNEEQQQEERVAEGDAYLKMCTLSEETSTRATQLKRACRKLLAIGLSKEDVLEALNRRYPRALSVSDLQLAIDAIESERRRQSPQSAREYQSSAGGNATSAGTHGTQGSASFVNDLFGSPFERKRKPASNAVKKKTDLKTSNMLAREKEHTRMRARNTTQSIETTTDAVDDSVEDIEDRTPRRVFYPGTEQFDQEAARIAHEMILLHKDGLISEHDSDLDVIATTIHLFEASTVLARIVKIDETIELPIET